MSWFLRFVVIWRGWIWEIENVLISQICLIFGLRPDEEKMKRVPLFIFQKCAETEWQREEYYNFFACGADFPLTFLIFFKNQKIFACGAVFSFVSFNNSLKFEKNSPATLFFQIFKKLNINNILINCLFVIFIHFLSF